MRATSTLATMLLGIVFLMTTKPQLVTSILVMGIAVFVGLIVSLLFLSPSSRQASSALARVNNIEDDPFLRKTCHG